jgi:hypothetical protein
MSQAAAASRGRGQRCSWLLDAETKRRHAATASLKPRRMGSDPYGSCIRPTRDAVGRGVYSLSRARLSFHGALDAGAGPGFSAARKAS